MTNDTRAEVKDLILDALRLAVTRGGWDIARVRHP